MTTIEVACEPAGSATGWTCRVVVRDAGGSTEHTVNVGPAELASLAPGATSPDDLVRRSFEFLLARERKESILRWFDLPAIGSYFPDYEREIARPSAR